MLLPAPKASVPLPVTTEAAGQNHRRINGSGCRRDRDRGPADVPKVNVPPLPGDSV